MPAGDTSQDKSPEEYCCTLLRLKTEISYAARKRHQISQQALQLALHHLNVPEHGQEEGLTNAKTAERLSTALVSLADAPEPDSSTASNNSPMRVSDMMRSDRAWMSAVSNADKHA